MLDGLLGRGFSSKCKSLIKAMRKRIEVVRRRAEAKQRFLREDLAKLLSNGLDINAYGRTEEFLAGLNLASCYDFIEETCEYIVKQLSRIEKQGECPEECREAVASLMFAAARFSDLPELRDLRNIFQQRYGNSLQAFVNQKFCEKLSVVPPARAKRLQVLHDITSEFSIKWDSKGFDQRMGSPSLHVQVDVQKTDVKQRHQIIDAKGRIQSSAERNVTRRDNSNNHNQEMVKQAPESPWKKGESSIHGGHFLLHGRQTSPGGMLPPTIKRYEQVKIENSSYGKMENTIDVGSIKKGNSVSNSRKGENSGPLTENKHSYTAVKNCEEVVNVRLSNSSYKKDVDNGKLGYMRNNNGICKTGKGEKTEAFSRERGENASNFRENLGKNDEVFTIDGGRNQTKALASIKRELEGESDRLKSHTNYALLPPYVKPKDAFGLPPYTKPKEDERKSSRVSSHWGSDSEHLINSSTCDIGNAAGQTCTEPDENVHEEQLMEPTKMKSHRHEKAFGHQDDKLSISKPRSTRKKYHKSLSGNDIVGSDEDGDVKRKSSSRRKDHSRRGLQMIFDEEHHRNNEEEMLIDELLIHYCKKPSSYNGGKLKKQPQAQSSHQIAHYGPDASKMATVPTRSISLPRDTVDTPEPKKAFNRSNTFQPDSRARHVHPKLPDYDDLAERFAAMKGRQVQDQMEPGR